MAATPAGEGGEVRHPSLMTVSAARRRILLTVLFATQALGGAGLVAAITAAGLAGRLVTGSTTLAGLPPGCLVVGIAAGSLLLSRVMTRRGRRPGLVAGYLGAAVGGGLALAGLRTHAFLLLLAAVLLIGLGNSSNLLARYAATDLVGPASRGRVISLIVFGASGGALLGPAVLSRLAMSSGGAGGVGGLFVTSAVTYGAASIVIALGLRPDPLWAQVQMAPVAPAGAEQSHGGDGIRLAGCAPQALRDRTAVAVIGLVILNFAMVVPMSMAPVYMAGAGAIAAASTVISVHVAAMYGTSPLSGWVTDRGGRLPVLWASGAILAGAGVVLAHAPARSLALMLVGLMLVGIAWNCGFVSCSAVLADAAATTPHPARLQGFADTCMNASGAVAALISGALLRTIGFPAIGWLVVALGVLVALLAAQELARRRARDWEPAPT